MDNILNDKYPVYAGEETVTASGYTLLGAMQRVVSASADSHLERALYSFECQMDGELEYLTSRLIISENEAILFSILCEKGAQQRVSLYDLARYLGCDNLEMLLHKSSIASLVERGLVVEEPVNKYFVPDEVLQAISRNEPWTDEVREYSSDGDLYQDIYERFVLAAGNRISKVAMYRRVHRLLEANAHLRFAKAVFSHALRIKEVSNGALCATKMLSPAKARKAETASF